MNDDAPKLSTNDVWRSQALVGWSAVALLVPFMACQPADPVTSGSGAGGASASSTTTGETTATSSGTGGATSSSTGSGGAPGTGGATSSTTSAAGTGGDTSAGSGGAPGCVTAGDCPGSDTECRKRTCDAGACGFDLAAAGTVLAAQTAKDCLEARCDGAGEIEEVPDDADLPDDGNECTDDTCDSGVPTFTPVPMGTGCAGGKKCNAGGACVECLDGGDCVSLVCDAATSTCAAASCNDAVKNGGETDVDCGGEMCAPCAAGKACGVNADCKGGLCAAGACAPTCTDGATNGGETGVDCGGPDCNKCDLGGACLLDVDCKTSNCMAGVCACGNDHLLISEIRSRGLGGAADEFIELYNPTSAPVILDTNWKIEARSNNAGSYGMRWKGSGKTIPPHGHYLIAHTGYVQMPAADDPFSGASGITDATSVRLVNAGAVVDAVCYGYSAATKTALMAAGYSCEGTPADNLPHKDAAGAGDVDVSIQRKPGGLAGNCIDTGDNATDFISTAPAFPQSTADAPTP